MTDPNEKPARDDLDRLSRSVSDLLEIARAHQRAIETQAAEARETRQAIEQQRTETRSLREGLEIAENFLGRVAEAQAEERVRTAELRLTIGDLAQVTTDLQRTTANLAEASRNQQSQINELRG